MDRNGNTIRTRRRDGFTLLETMIAMTVLAVGVLGTAALFGVAIGTNKGQGEIGTRTIEYAQDKMEQLTALTYADAGTDTTTYPSTPVGGPGLGGAMGPNTTIGSVDPAAPVAQFVDYLDGSGNLVPGAQGALYTRQWMIQTDATGTMKTITVVAIASNSGGGRGLPPSTRLVCIKTKF